MDLHIPSDTLFNIFTLLKRSELAKVSLVCKEWKKVTLNPHFVWPIALKYMAGQDYVREFESDEDGFAVFSKIDPARDYFTLTAKYRKMEVREQTFNLYAFDWNPEEKESEVISPEKILKLYKLATEHPMIFKFQIRFNKNKSQKSVNFRKEIMRRGKWMSHKSNCILNYEIYLRVNFASFEKHFSKRPVDKNFPGAEFIFEAVSNEHSHLISQWCRTHEFKQATIPIKTVATQKQPYGFTSDITLKKYQLNAISWMKSIEEDVDVGFDCSELVGWKAAGTKVLFDLVNDNFVLSHEVGDYIKHVSAKGGILADEMGLGKTLTMVGLILANPGDPLNVSMADDKLSFEDDEEEEEDEEENSEAPAKKAKKDEDEEMDENENKNEEKKQKEKEKEKDKYKDDRLPEHLLFKTQATVVICPNHLVQQWQGEIAKRTSPPLCVVILTTKTDLYMTTYNDIVEADVVIVSATLLKNPNYFNLGRSANASISRGSEERRIASWVPTSLVRIRKTAEGGLTQKKPILEHFLWHRIVLDEGHEVLDDPFYQLTLKSIKAKHYWYMSGTPFPNSEVMYGVVNYLQFPPTEAYMSWSYVDLAVENLYWRNTKESTKDEYDIPDVVEDVVLMDFTDIERIYYESADKEDEQRAMCGWLQMSGTVKDISGDAERKSLTKIRQDAINHKKDRIRGLVESVNQYKKTVKELKERQHITENISRQIKSVEKSIETAEDEIKKYTIKLINLEHSKKYEGPDMSSTATIQSKDNNNNNDINNNNNTNNTTTTTKETTKEKTVEETEEKGDEEKGDVEKEGKDEEKDKKEEDGETWDEAKLKKLTIPKLTVLMSKMGMKAAEPKTKKADLISGILKFQKNTDKSVEPATEKQKGKETKKSDSKRKRDEEEVEEEESEPAPRPIVRAESLLKSKQQEQLNLLYSVDQLGTKLGNFIHYLKKLWEQSSKHRVIVFSQFNTMLHQISDVLSSQGIESAFVQGNVLRRNKALNAFKSEDSTIRVILLSLENAASGTNLVEASHIILLDPVTGTRKEAQAVESQAIGRAHRQGQTNQVTVVRFLIRNTIEHTMYIQNYLEEVKEENGEDDDDQCTPVSTPTKSSRPKLMRTSTIGTMLATHAHLRRNRSIMDLIENDNLL